MEFYFNRYKNIEELKYDFEVVTPMFVAGADQNKAELREPTLKGLLRFWWRATNKFTSIPEMKKEEEELFGSTISKSQVTIKIFFNEKIPPLKNLPEGKEFTIPGKRPKGDILKYLTIGCAERKFIGPGSNFLLSMKFPKEHFEEIYVALYALYTFGGIGSKCRNGFGSLKLIKGELKPEKKKLEEIFQNEPADYIRFNTSQQLFKTKELHTTWINALSEVGLLYRKARLDLELRHQFDKRAKVALPIEAKRESNSYKYKGKRQAKPFFLHVSKTNAGQFRGKINFLPTKKMTIEDKSIFDKMLNIFREEMD